MPYGQLMESTGDLHKRNPRDALNRALGFFRSGETSKALALSQKIIKLDPTFVDAWLLLSQLQLAIQRPERALQCAEKVLLLEPGNMQAELLRAESLLADSQIAAATAALKSLEDKSLQVALSQRLVGNLYAGLQSYESASRCFQRALKLDPDDIDGWHLYSGVLFAQGFLVEAEKALDQVLRLNPQHAEALLTRANMRRQTRQDNHLRQLEIALAAGQLNQQDSIMLGYAMAKELEDLEDYPQAFQRLQRAAEDNDRRLGYSVERDVGFMEELSAIYSQKISASSTDPVLGEGIIFVVSLPRAGSTLVDRILASHSGVTSIGESSVFHEAVVQHARAASARNKMTFVDALAHIDYPALGKSYLEKLGGESVDAPLVIDKTPANLQYLGLIHKALPGAKIIHVHKSPMDACYSIYKTYFSRGYGYSYSLQKLGQYYVAYRKMMNDWRVNLPGEFLDVSYEQLVEDQSSETRRMLEYCGLDWQPRCLDFHMNSSPTATASVVQVRQPMFRSSLGKWRCYEQQLAPLTALLHQAGIETS
jgi:tetratricopeptide (TPR) repeat protein